MLQATRTPEQEELDREYREQNGLSSKEEGATSQPPKTTVEMALIEAQAEVSRLREEVAELKAHLAVLFPDYFNHKNQEDETKN